MLHVTRTWLATAAFGLAAATTANAAEIQVLASPSMREALSDVVPQFETQSGFKVTIRFYPGETLVAKVREGAPTDVVIAPPANIVQLINAGRLAEGTRVAFVQSRVGVAVKAGARKPDISTPEAVKSTFLNAKSIGLSQGPSGFDLLGQMSKMGILDQVRSKIVQPDLGVPVGTLVARGTVEIGVQQFSELLPVKGIALVGPLPGPWQDSVAYGIARSANTQQQRGAGLLVKYLTSPSTVAALKALGFDPP